PAWESRFGAERVELLTMDEIQSAPHAALARLLGRLELSPIDPSIDLDGRVNDAYVPRSTRAHRVRAAVFRYLVDNHHFRALEAARAGKRALSRLIPREGPRARSMRDDERTFLEARLAGE